MDKPTEANTRNHINARRDCELLILLKISLKLQPQNALSSLNVACLPGFGRTDNMKDIVVDGRLDAETAGFCQIVSAYPAVSVFPLQFLSMSSDAQTTVNDVIRTEHDGFISKASWN